MYRLKSHIHLRPDRLHVWIEKFLSQNATWTSVKRHSVENRPIYILTAGNSLPKIVFWSQMHGNESSGTYALTDLLVYLQEDQRLLGRLLERYSIVVIPMLNPDGADRFTRYNALGSDLNREGLRTLSPETEILKDILSDETYLAFNLHDQRTLFSVGSTSTPATLSLLAPSSKTQKGESARSTAIMITSRALENFESDSRKYISRFSDEYYPQAMGEWCTDRGIVTILVECGGYYNDFHRVKSREMCFLFLKNALSSLFDIGVSTQAYLTLPENSQNLRDVLLRNVPVKIPSGVKTIDLGFTAQYNSASEAWAWQLDDIGDLQLRCGYTDVDLSEEDPVDYQLIKPNFLYHLQDLPKTWHKWFIMT